MRIYHGSKGGVYILKKGKRRYLTTKGHRNQRVSRRVYRNSGPDSREASIANKDRNKMKIHYVWFNLDDFFTFKRNDKIYMDKQNEQLDKEKIKHNINLLGTDEYEFWFWYDDTDERSTDLGIENFSREFGGMGIELKKLSELYISEDSSTRQKSSYDIFQRGNKKNIVKNIFESLKMDYFKKIEGQLIHMDEIESEVENLKKALNGKKDDEIKKIIKLYESYYYDDDDDEDVENTQKLHLLMTKKIADMNGSGAEIEKIKNVLETMFQRLSTVMQMKSVKKYSEDKFNKKLQELQNAAVLHEKNFFNYALMSDYIRMKILERFKGLYLDTDVKIDVEPDNMVNFEQMLATNVCFMSPTKVGEQNIDILYLNPNSNFASKFPDSFETAFRLELHKQQDKLVFISSLVNKDDGYKGAIVETFQPEIRNIFGQTSVAGVRYRGNIYSEENNPFKPFYDSTWV